MDRRFAFATAITCGLLAGPAMAMVDSPKPGAVSASTLKLPDKPGSIKGLSDDASVQVFSGHVSYSVPFELPQGRAGFGPQLSLSYSGELGNGPLGIGWSLGLISIKRSLRHGVPTYTDADELELVGIGGGGRLVPDSTIPGRYWVEGQGKAVKVDRQGNLFIATDGNGTVYVLGGTQGSKQGDANRTSAWYVDRITNVAGEQILIEYEQDQGQIYFHEISWGPKLSGTCAGPAFRLTGHTESRPDVALSWASGIEVRTAKRFDSFQVRSFCETLRSYDLTYNTTSESYKTDPQLSRLVKVHMTGRGGQGALPDLAFGYAAPATAAAGPMGNVAGWQLNQRGTSIADVDGDGVGDLLRLELGNHAYKKNVGGAYAEPRPLTGAGHIDLEASRLMDVDGDARAELVTIVNDTWRVYRLKGEKWEPVLEGAWPGTSMVPLSAPDTVFADINGDGSTDVIQGAATSIRIRFGSRTGLAAAVTLPRISAEDAVVEPGDSAVRFVDMNGDGLADVVYLTDAWAKIWLGRGDGTFVYFNRVAYPWTSVVSEMSNVLIADMDRDGIQDLVRISAGDVSFYPGLPDGTFWPVGRMVARPAGDAVESVVTIADANGNGSQDIVWSTPSGMWVLDLAGPTSEGMLTSIDNGMGKTTTFQYEGSGVLAIMDENAGNPWTYKLPISVPVPIYATIDPGAGGVPRVVRYGVRDGFWDGEERRFGGFLIGGKTVPAETAAQTYYEETRFYAGIGGDRVLRGKPYLVEQQDGAKRVFTRKMFAVEARPVAGLPSSALTKKAATTVEDGYNLEGVAKPIQTFTTYEYDDEVRPTAEHHSGRLDVTGDEKEVRRSYADSDYYWVRDKVAEESVYEGDGQTLVSRTRTFYTEDGQTPLALGDAGKGWAAQTKGWLASPADPTPGLSWRESGREVVVSASTYDQYGNVTSSYQGGVTRTLGYDSASLRATSESVTVDAGRTLTWGMSWDNALGLPKTMTEPNQVSTTIEYDELGRYVGARVGAYPEHIRYVYNWTAPRPTTTTYVYDGELETNPGVDPTTDWENATGWRQTTLVANGAGEDLFSATRLATNRWIVSDWKERDSRGKVVLHGDPFYWDGADPRAASPPVDLPATDPNAFHAQTLKYDALGRLTDQSLPNGGQKLVTYRAFEQTVTASELDPVRSVMDGQGRIMHTERKVKGVLETVDALYNAAGQVTAMSLQGGKAENPARGTAVHQFLYDTLGRLVWAKDPDIGTREMRYADAGFLIRHKNGAGDVLAFFYDLAGRLTGRGARAASSFADPAADGFASPAAGDFVYHYDTAASEVSACSAPRTAGRLASVDEPNGGTANFGRVAFCYDQLGRQRVMYRSINGVTGWQVDRLSSSGLPLQSQNDDGFKLVAQYDRAGRTISLIDGSLDQSNIWQAGTEATPDSFAGLDAAGRVLREAFGNGLLGTYTRDEIGLTSSLAIKKESLPALFGLTIQRNKYGAPTMVSDNVTTGQDQSAQYVYDGAARLTNATIGQAAATQWHFRYEYDGLQNMIARGQVGPTASDDTGIFAGNYFYGERNQGPRQLSRITDKDCDGATTTFDYDLAGRMIQETSPKGTKVLSYDGYDQLLGVTISGATSLAAAYGYDGLRTYSTGKEGTQVWFTGAYTLAPTGSRWHYVSVGDRLVARLTFENHSASLASVLAGAGIVREISMRAGQHAPQAFVLVLTGGMLFLLVIAVRRRPSWQTSSAVVTSYAFLAATSGCGSTTEQRRHSLEVANTRIYFHQGIAAGPTLLTDHNGVIKDERRFEPFGQPINANLTKAVDPTNNLNKETNADTGWSYHGARWMAPQTARWMTPDPPVKGPEKRFIREPWSLNPYSYVGQSPTLYWDPDGSDGKTFEQAAINRLAERYKRAAIDEHKLCMGSFIAGVKGLLGDKEFRTRKGDDVIAKVFPRLGAHGESVRHSVDFRVRQVSYNGELQGTASFQGEPRPTDAMTRTIGEEKGWSVFGLSIASGYHVATIAVDTRGSQPQFYYFDQTLRGLMAAQDVNKQILKYTQQYLDKREAVGKSYDLSLTIVRVVPTKED